MGVLLLCGLHSSSRNRRAPFCSCMRMSVGLHCVQSAHDILRSRRSRSWQSGGSGVFFWMTCYNQRLDTCIYPLGYEDLLQWVSAHHGPRTVYMVTYYARGRCTAPNMTMIVNSSPSNSPSISTMTNYQLTQINYIRISWELLMDWEQMKCIQKRLSDQYFRIGPLKWVSIASLNLD